MRGDAALPREAYALLAQANLHRMRGQWDAAAEKCMAALRLAPDSASANSLLGDIYENQGRYDDAAQWYRMALDANPDSPADRLKLDRLHGREDAQRPLFPVFPGAAAVTAPPAPTKQSAAGWLLRLPRDPEAALRLSAAAAALALILVIGFAYRAVHPGGPLRSLGLGGDAVVSSKPVVVPPVPGTLPTDPDGTPAHDPSETALLAALQGAADLSRQGIAVYDVQVDPRVSRMTVTFGVPASAGVTQGQVSQDALRVLQDAAAEQAADTFTARCFLIPSSGSGPVLAFVGDAARDALQPSASTPPAASTGSGPTDAQALALFTNTWWSATADVQA